LYTWSVSVGFRPTEEDLRVIEANRREDEKTSDVIRRALRLLDREAWEERARADMHRLRAEDLSAEADAWEYEDPCGAESNVWACTSLPIEGAVVLRAEIDAPTP